MICKNFVFDVRVGARATVITEHLSFILKGPTFFWAVFLLIISFFRHNHIGRCLYGLCTHSAFVDMKIF